MWHPKVTHMRTDRILGIVHGFPLCLSGAKLLDMDATGRKMTRDPNEVTCKKCRRLLKLSHES
jgi:hypothetical protein